MLNNVAFLQVQPALKELHLENNFIANFRHFQRQPHLEV